jgi:glycosyl transferase family 25
MDKIIYINLEHRKDRKESIEKQLSIFSQEKVQRFSAIKHTNGAIGCSKSHVTVLELAIKNKWKNLLVLEDDMLWNEQFDEQLNILEQKLSQPYDVIVLGGMWPHYDKKTLKLTKCYGTGAYIVNSSYYETLLNNFKEGLEKLENYHYSPPKNQFIWNKLKKQYTEEFNLDNYWNRLQERDNWFIVQMMYSKEDYSDIAKSKVDYSQRYKMN